MLKSQFSDSHIDGNKRFTPLMRGLGAHREHDETSGLGQTIPLIKAVNLRNYRRPILIQCMYWEIEKFRDLFGGSQGQSQENGEISPIPFASPLLRQGDLSLLVAERIAIR